MTERSFDTFEDEKEIDELIKRLQSQSLKYMQQPDAWEFDCSEKILEKQK
ncbi:hypothetical protein IJ182_09540 [bacterium]|nr:hypothetical protein [bacterium]